MRLAKLAPLGLWLVGMLLAFYPVLLSGFARVPGDLADARLVNYLLEHGYRWLERRPPHRDLWSPPFFHPEPNVGAYSDVLLSAGPFYWPWRALGLAPLTAFQLCFLTLASLNYLAFYLFQVLCLRFPPVAAGFGAFLFAFAGPRLVHMAHLQLHTHFYTVLCLYAAFRLFEGRPRPGQIPNRKSQIPNRKSQNSNQIGIWDLRFGIFFGWVALLFAGLVGQFYGSFYLGWFLGLAAAACAPWLLAVRDYRRRLAEVVRAHRGSACLWGLLAGLALADLAWHYLRAARSAGYQSDFLARWGIPYLTSWWSRGRESWFNLTNGLVALGVLRENPWPVGEHALGLGPVTYAVALAGLLRLRRRRPVACLLGAGLTLFVCVSSVAPGVSLWQFLYPHVPAGAALRALCRIALVFLIPLALCAAWLVKELAPRRPALATALVLLCVLEQGRTIPSFEKAEHGRDVAPVAARVPPDARAFLVVPARPLETDRSYFTFNAGAMWASLETGVPTINGHSGRVPRGWDFEAAMLDGPTDAEHVEGLLGRWLRGRGEGQTADVRFRVIVLPSGATLFLILDP